jgi:hypothetical protein
MKESASAKKMLHQLQRRERVLPVVKNATILDMPFILQ